MSDRVKVRLVAAGTSTFLTLLVAASLVLALGVLTDRVAAPTLPGRSEIRLALPALSDTTAPPVTGPGAIPPGLLDPGSDDGNAPGEGGNGPRRLDPGPSMPPEDDPAVGARVGSDDVGGLGLVGANVPVNVGNASGETTTTSIEVLGVEVELETSDALVDDVLCFLLCSP